MKFLFQTCFLCLGILAAGAFAAQAAVSTGDPAPEFQLKDTRGHLHSLSDYRGRIVVLEWVNFDCPFVKKHYRSGQMPLLQKSFTQKGVVWLSINSSAHGKQGHYHPEEAEIKMKENGASPTAYLLDFDGETGRAYGAQTTPHMFIIDAEGRLAYQGAIDSIPSADPADVPRAQNYVQQALEALLSGEEPPIKATKAYGCSVKY